MPDHRPRFPARIFVWVLFIVLAVMLFMFFTQRPAGREMSADEFWHNIRRGKVVGDLAISESEIRGQLDGSAPGANRFYVRYEWKGDGQFVSRLDDALADDPGRFTYHFANTGALLNILISLIPWLLVFGFIWFFVFRKLRHGGFGGTALDKLGKSHFRLLKAAENPANFASVAGLDGVKQQLADVVAYLRDPSGFARLGAAPPEPVLLTGPTGSGKTLLARAVAGQAGVPLLWVSGADFVETFVGVGASRVRDLFRQARSNTPCVLFLDDVDGFGQRRRDESQRANEDERQQTLLALLAELDSLSTDRVALVVMAASNRADLLDPALVRPGRLGRRIQIPLPDEAGRSAVLNAWISSIRRAGDVDVARLAAASEGLSAADLRCAVNDAAVAATLAGETAVAHVRLEEALTRRRRS